MTDLDTARGPVRVGAMICYDREFPESARLLMLRGAELILTPNACPMEINRLSQLKYAGAAVAVRDGGRVIAGGDSQHVFEGSGAQLGQAVYLHGAGVGGQDQLRAESEAHGNAYRHPKKYGLLTDTRIDKPFIRADYRE